MEKSSRATILQDYHESDNTQVQTGVGKVVGGCLQKPNSLINQLAVQQLVESMPRGQKSIYNLKKLSDHLPRTGRKKRQN